MTAFLFQGQPIAMRGPQKRPISQMNPGQSPGEILREGPQTDAIAHLEILQSPTSMTKIGFYDAEMMIRVDVVRKLLDERVKKMRRSVVVA